MEQEKKDNPITLAELRIGSILSYRGKLVHVTSLTRDVEDENQETISFCELGTSINGHKGWNLSLYKNLDRVPLTEDVLEACGFDTDGPTRLHQFALFPFYQENPQTENRFNISARLKVCSLNQVTKTTLEMINRDAVNKTFSGTALRYPEHLHDLQILWYTITGEELAVDGEKLQAAIEQKKRQ